MNSKKKQHVSMQVKSQTFTVHRYFNFHFPKD